MVKVFFVGVAIVVLAITGVFTAVFGPLIAGADRNLGHPHSPLDSPVPRFVIGLFHSAAGHTTPALLLTAVLGTTALLTAYMLGTLLAHGLKRWKIRRRMWDEMRWRGRVTALRESKSAASPAAQAKAEFESMWE